MVRSHGNSDSEQNTEHLRRHPHVNATILPDGHVALHLKNDWIYVLTPLGAIVWEFSDGEHGADEIVDEIAEIVEIKPSPELRQQIVELIDELKNVSLLVPHVFAAGPEVEETIPGGGCAKTWHPGARPKAS